MNVGKQFESDFKKSKPDNVLLYRLPDAAQSFGGNTNLRFSNKNPFDYIMWDKISRTLYALELKSVKGKSVSFERTAEEKGEIHYHQIKGLKYWSEYDVVSGLIIEFREIETTVFIEISELDKLLDRIPKKSFNFNDLDKNDVLYIVIPQTKKRTRYTYDIGFLIEKTKKEKIK